MRERAVRGGGASSPQLASTTSVRLPDERKRFCVTALALATMMVDDDAPPAASSFASNAAAALRGAPCACAEIARTASIDAAPEAARDGGRPRGAAGAARVLPPGPSAWGSAAPALRLPSAFLHHQRHQSAVSYRN